MAWQFPIFSLSLFLSLEGRRKKEEEDGDEETNEQIKAQVCSSLFILTTHQASVVVNEQIKEAD
jgi:hypothetical protein